MTELQRRIEQARGMALGFVNEPDIRPNTEADREMARLAINLIADILLHITEPRDPPTTGMTK